MTKQQCSELAIKDSACKVQGGGWYIAMKNFGKPKKEPEEEKSEEEKSEEEKSEQEKSEEEKTGDEEEKLEEPAEPEDVYGRCYCCND